MEKTILKWWIGLGIVFFLATFYANMPHRIDVNEKYQILRETAYSAVDFEKQTFRDVRVLYNPEQAKITIALSSEKMDVTVCKTYQFDTIMLKYHFALAPDYTIIACDSTTLSIRFWCATIAFASLIGLLIGFFFPLVPIFLFCLIQIAVQYQKAGKT